jgi:Flp pilus assembly protein TadG
MRARSLTEFANDRRGATAVLFGICSVVLMMVIGVAFDSARLYSISDKVRNGLDAAALAAAKLLDEEGASDAEVMSRAIAYFNTYKPQILKSNVELATPDVRTNRTDYSVTVSVDVNYQTVFGGLINVPFVKFSPSATVVYKTKKIELALVLDVTGSMGAGGRMSALKSAATDLIEVLQANSPSPGAVRVAVAPYSSAVNVGPYYDIATGNAGGADTCVVERNSMPGAVVDDAPGPGRYASISNTGDNNQYTCPLAEILPLQDISVPAQKTGLINLINSFMPAGFTAGHIGTAWGWYMVSPRWQGVWPAVSRPRPSGPDVLKAVLLMTDGEFNTAYFGGNKNNLPYTTPNSSGDQALSLCQNMRDAGVAVFTVAFNALPEAETLLQLCAGSPDNAFTAASASELSSKFRTIGDRLSMLRISR